jgi:hypothetical protein
MPSSSSKTTPTSCQEWIRQQEGVCGGGESYRRSYQLEQKPISSKTTLTFCRNGSGNKRVCAGEGRAREEVISENRNQYHQKPP